MLLNVNVPAPKNQSTFRQYQFSYPVYYSGSIEPDMLVTRTVLESWNPKTKKWDYHSYSEKQVWRKC